MSNYQDENHMNKNTHNQGSSSGNTMNAIHTRKDSKKAHINRASIESGLELAKYKDDENFQITIGANEEDDIGVDDELDFGVVISDIVYEDSDVEEDVSSSQKRSKKNNRSIGEVPNEPPGGGFGAQRYNSWFRKDFWSSFRYATALSIQNIKTETEDEGTDDDDDDDDDDEYNERSQLSPKSGSNKTKKVSGAGQSDNDADDGASSSLSPPDGGKKRKRKTRKGTVITAGEPPDMWSWPYIGLYAHYAAIGILGAPAKNFCYYSYHGDANVCGNAAHVIALAWNFKIIYALVTDSFHPFGYRRKSYIMGSWAIVFVILLFMGLSANNYTAESWLWWMTLTEAIAMIAEVPADGYAVELGKLEPIENRGQIIATARLIRYSFKMGAGILQTFLLNGPTTNAADCEISWYTCWSWGLTVSQYYYLLAFIVFILFIPIIYLEEPDASHIPHRTVKEFFLEAWDSLKNRTTMCIVLWIIGIHAFGNMSPEVATANLQYYVIRIPSLLSGMNNFLKSAVLAFSIWIFKRFLINKNWRAVNYLSCFLCASLNQLWILVFWNVAQLRNGWFTIFIDVDQYFANGLARMLLSMAMIELAKPGQEATLYELLASIGNSATTMGGIIGTQLLSAFDAAGCTSNAFGEGEECAEDSVDLYNYDNDEGPAKYTKYILTITCISVLGTLVFAPFLPQQKQECHEWKKLGEEAGESATRGKITLFVAFIVVVYGMLGSVLLVNEDYSCMKWLGGEGCE